MKKFLFSLLIHKHFLNIALLIGFVIFLNNAAFSQTPTCTPIPGPPIAANDFYSGNKPIYRPVGGGLLSNDYDPNGFSIEVSGSNNQHSAYGNLSIGGQGDFNYVPIHTPGYTGSYHDQFTYQITGRPPDRK